MRVARQEEAWGKVLDEVTKGYIQWKYRSPADAEPNAPTGPSADAEQPEQTYAYGVDAYDIFTRTARLTIQRRADSISPAIDLIRHGYLAKSPTKPTVAVAITTLELLYRLRQRKPSFSIEAFAKVVCDYYNVGLYDPRSDVPDLICARYLIVATYERSSQIHSRCICA